METTPTRDGLLAGEGSTASTRDHLPPVFCVKRVEHSKTRVDALSGDQGCRVLRSEAKSLGGEDTKMAGARIPTGLPLSAHKIWTDMSMNGQEYDKEIDDEVEEIGDKAQEKAPKPELRCIESTCIQAAAGFIDSGCNQPYSIPLFCLEPGVKQNTGPSFATNEGGHVKTGDPETSALALSVDSFFEVYPMPGSEAYDVMNALVPTTMCESREFKDMRVAFEEKSGMRLIEMESVTSPFNQVLHQSLFHTLKIMYGQEPSVITAYHGTLCPAATNICKYGFKMPVAPRSQHGTGWYCSPLPLVAAQYCPKLHGQKVCILVCDVITGLTTIGAMHNVNFGCNENGIPFMTSSNINGNVLCCSHQDQMLVKYCLTFLPVVPITKTHPMRPLPVVPGTKTNHNNQATKAKLSVVQSFKGSSFKGFRVGQTVRVTQYCLGPLCLDGLHGTIVDILKLDRLERAIVCLWDKSMESKVLARVLKGGWGSGSDGLFSLPFSKFQSFDGWPDLKDNVRARKVAQDFLGWKPGEPWPPSSEAQHTKKRKEPAT